MVESTQDNARQIITLWPNRSASWQEAKRWLWVLAVPVTAVAVGWSLAGVWMILPFAGLEFGLVALVMYHVAGRTCRREVVIVEPDRVVIHRGRHFPEKLWVLARPQAHLQVRHPQKEVDLMELQLVDEDFRIPIARWLNHEDRRMVRKTLLEAGLTEVSDQWWRQD